MKAILKKNEIKPKKIIPLISIQNSEKNNLLKILFNTNIENDSSLSGNKFINIFRYNPDIKEPKFYHLLLALKQNKYQLSKDEKYKEINGIEYILEEYKRVNEKLKNAVAKEDKNNFYMTEINSISFPKMKKFFLEFDLCDFPLFSEEFKDCGGGVLEIIKNKIENFIFIFNMTNYKDKRNYQIIRQIVKILGVPIVNSLILFENVQKNNSNEFQNFINNLTKNFPDFKDFNYYLNKIIRINFILMESELLLTKSFYHFLRYHSLLYIFNDSYKEKTINSGNSLSLDDGFFKYIESLIGNDVKESYERLENSDEIQSEIGNAIKEMKEKDKIILPIKEQNNNIGGFSEDEEEEEVEKEDNKNILTKFYIYFDKKKSQEQNSTSSELINYFEFHQVFKNTFSQLSKNFEIKIIDDNDQTIIDNLKFIITQIENTKAFKNTLNNFKVEIDLLKEENQNLIYIPFLGLSNSGKSTLLNAIIGKDILPVKSEECTKKGIIISYSEDNEPDISIRKATLKSKGEKHYFEYNKNIIAKGFANVKHVLESVNWYYEENETNFFYYVRTKIKLFDEMNLKDYLKKKIFLIDFPGYGTNSIFQKNIIPKIFKFCNCFAFVVKDSKIKEEENQKILKEALKTIETSHDKLINGFIKSCLFISNLFPQTQTIDNTDLEKGKRDIKELTNVKNEKDINICFIRADKCLRGRNNYNYFFNIEETIEDEYSKFVGRYKFNLYNIINKKPSFFEEHFNEIISKKLEEIGLNYVFDNKMGISGLNEIKKELDNFHKEKFSEKLKEDIAKKISFSRFKLKQKFGYDDFEKGFKILIENAFNEMIENKKQIIQKQINVFKKIIESKKISDEISPESFEQLKQIEEKYIKKSEDLYLNHHNKSEWDITSKFLSNIIDYLNLIKINIKDFLKKKDWEKVKKEIKDKISNDIEELSHKIEKYIDEINNENSNLILDREKNLWNKYIVINITDFKEFFTVKVSQKGFKIAEEINGELNKCFEDTKYQILKNKGFRDWIESFFSNEGYLYNFIDVVNATLKSKLNYILHLISIRFKEYKDQVISLIQEKIESIELGFINLEPETIDKIKPICEKKINQIEKVISENLKKV